jgi:Phytanoyl-CoA dioxygenase (PhyH)
MSDTPHLDALQRDGFVVIPNLLDKHMLLGQKAACKYLTDGARQGRWPFVRTVPKQYPPWPKWEKGDHHNIWGVQHLLHPDMTVRDTFAELYFSDAVLDVVKELVGLKNDEKADDKLVMELFNLLVSPAEKQDFELCWHRDDVRPDVTPEEEDRQLKEKSPGGAQLHAQYNIALFDDASLIVVPGSHRRIRTEVERNADPFEPNMPGQLVVKLKHGDAVFYDSNILHRGSYKGIDTKSELGRMTLHGSVGLAGHGTERARQVLQHAVGEYVDRAEFPEMEGPKRERAEAMRRRLVAMGKGDDLGYSLVG